MHSGQSMDSGAKLRGSGSFIHQLWTLGKFLNTSVPQFLIFTMKMKIIVHTSYVSYKD